MRKTLSIIIILLAAITLHAGQHADAGDKAYNNKDYNEALTQYRLAVETEGVSSNLYYNLGNTYYRMGDIGQAVLNYQRALKVDPSNDDARANLQFVQSKIANTPEDDSSFLTNMHRNIVSVMSPDAWAWTAFGLFVVVLGAIALYLFTSNVTLRKIGFFGGFVVLVVFVYVFIIAWTTASAINDHSDAVITAPVSNLRSQPSSKNDKSEKVVPVNQGITVQIVDSVATPDDPMTPMWYEVKINNSTRAWIAASDVERV